MCEFIGLYVYVSVRVYEVFMCLSPSLPILDYLSYLVVFGTNLDLFPILVSRNIIRILTRHLNFNIVLNFSGFIFRGIRKYKQSILEWNEDEKEGAKLMVVLPSFLVLSFWSNSPISLVPNSSLTIHSFTVTKRNQNVSRGVFTTLKLPQ